MENKKTVKFKVNGMHCNGCANKIKNGISSLSLENQTDVNVESGEVKVIFDSRQVSLVDLKTIISQAGFSVEGVEVE